MATKTCDVNLLDTNALLPPRKRLLAGLRRENSEINPPIPIAIINNHGTDYDAHVVNLLNSQLSDPNLSNEEIVESSRHAAVEATKIAEAARSKAEQKAAIAAHAVAVAKNALDLVTMLMDEEAARKEIRPKRNKIKKRATVDASFGKRKGSNTLSSRRKDAELARELHQAINSSPRIMKSSYKLGSDTISQKRKRVKNHEKGGVSNSGILIGEGDISNEINLRVETLTEAI